MKRWPIIRHVRYFYLSWCFWRWWRNFGGLLGAVPNERDLNYLESVWKGKI
jgi:hypothetical protein